MKSGHYISADMVDEKNRNDFWRETSSIIYEVKPTLENDEKVMSGSVRSRLFGNMVVGNTTFSNQFCDRTPKIIARTDLDLYLLQLVLAGDYRGDFNGKNVEVKPGDIFLLDLTQVMTSKKDAGARVTLAIPRKELNKAFPGKNLHGLVLPSNVATNKILFNFILTLDRIIDTIDQNDYPEIQESLMVLLKAAINRQAFTLEEYLAVSLPLRQRVLDHIDANLADPNLSPKTIMQQFKLSHSHLYRAFEPDSGVTKLIRNKRLDLAYRRLINDGGRKLSMKEVAYACGFSDRAQFTKFFKERFGIAPQDLKGFPKSPDHNPATSLTLHTFVSERIQQRQPEEQS